MNFMDMVLIKEDDQYFVESLEGTVKLAIPNERLEYSGDLTPYVNKEVILGIRPEDIEDISV